MVKLIGVRPSIISNSVVKDGALGALAAVPEDVAAVRVL
jgi:hypothetical protein